MRPIWNGSISFGLVSIPVSLFPAIRREELKFRLLRKSDLSPINYKRVAEVDGKEVPWDQIVKGYEYEKGQFVVLKEEDFARVDVEATQTVEILSFARVAEVDPLLFWKPYYMEAAKGGSKAYVLLRDALLDTRKIGIAKVVIKERQHLAAIKALKEGLILELMHFPDALVDVTEFKKPGSPAVSQREVRMAQELISGMTARWNPNAFKDDYQQAVEKMIEAKIEQGDKLPPVSRRPRKPHNVIDLVAVLQKSIQQAHTGPRKQGKAARGDRRRRA